MKRPSLRLVGSLLTLLTLSLSALGGSSAEATGRAALLQEMARRPADPWPRGIGHVVMGMPGLPEDLKAYHEPGGSFSPAFATFGISLWVVDEQDRLLTTSDAIPLEQVEQRWVWATARGWPPLPDLPAVETRTPYYRCSWSVVGEGRYRLYVRPESGRRVWIMVRRPGPSGGRIQSLQMVDRTLFINDRWTMQFRGPGVRADIADPRREPDSETFWPAEHAWGYARIRVMPAQDTWVNVQSVRQAPPSSLPTTPGRALVKVGLPDDRFSACLDAQIAQLAMGLVSNETRPGDPNNYPLNWLRDGAYSIVALACAGHVEVARELCRPFAEQDFFGGFGSEADAPGLALWALEEVAALANDPTFEDWLWPHVSRKAALIQEMLSATGQLRKPFAGPVVPAHAGKADLNLVCDSAQDGLVVGRMDWHRPLLFVNAASYRGLVSAARLAQRRGFADQASVWNQRAQALRSVWNSALDGTDSGNIRTLICGLHPTWVVTNRQAYTDLLSQRRAKSHDANGQLKERPSWTYFELATAHQELLLGNANRTWADLEWFWRNQASPGLFTWWEGTGEENSFGRWEQAMGWVKPPHVTPHYWTAAEMALLQLNMLVTVDESTDHPRLVIGLGLRPEWMDQKLEVKGMVTRLGVVDWEWRRGRLTVRHRGAEAEIVPGPAFPPGLDLRVR